MGQNDQETPLPPGPPEGADTSSSEPKDASPESAVGTSTGSVSDASSTTDSNSVTEGNGAGSAGSTSPDETVNYDSGSPYSAYGYDGGNSSPSEASSPSSYETSYADSSSGNPPSDANQEAASSEADEDGGGPVKSFLEHLEDLRWVIVKCSAALFVGMLVCLIGTNYMVKILKYPLQRAGKVRSTFVTPDTNYTVGLALGTNLIATIKSDFDTLAGIKLGTNRMAVLELVPVVMNDQTVLSVKVTQNPDVLAQLDKGPDLVYLDPATPFMSSLHIAFYGGIVMVAPLLLYFLGQYILPALRWKEKKYFMRGFFIGLGLFLAGVAFCYFWMAPVALKAAEQYSLWMGIKVPEWRAEMYFSFLCKFMLGMGLGFEMPVVLLALVKIGILDYQKLAGFRRYMIVINLILGAVLTTPEVVTQILMFVPLQLLYEVSIWIAWYWERKEKKRAAAEAQAKGENPE